MLKSVIIIRIIVSYLVSHNLWIINCEWHNFIFWYAVKKLSTWDEFRGHKLRRSVNASSFSAPIVWTSENSGHRQKWKNLDQRFRFQTNFKRPQTDLLDVKFISRIKNFDCFLKNFARCWISGYLEKNSRGNVKKIWKILNFRNEILKLWIWQTY